MKKVMKTGLQSFKNLFIKSPEIPGAVVLDDHHLLDVLPEAGIFDRVDLLLGVDVEMDALHDLAERCTQVERKVGVLHTSEGEEKYTYQATHIWY